MSVDVYATVLHGEGAGRCVYYTAAEWPDESHHAPDCGGTRSRPQSGWGRAGMLFGFETYRSTGQTGKALRLYDYKSAPVTETVVRLHPGPL